jgi:hypothetical protein
MAKSPSIPLLAAGVALLAAAVLLNPSPARHRATIKESMGERNPIARVLALGAVTAFASSYHSLGVASYTTAGDRILSVGALGLVYVRE